MNSTRLGDDIETAPPLEVDDRACERALAYVRRHAGTDGDVELVEQALGLAAYEAYDRERNTGRRRSVVREPREFMPIAASVVWP